MVLFYDMIFTSGRFWRKEREDDLKVRSTKKKSICSTSDWNSTEKVFFTRKKTAISRECYRGSSVLGRTRLLFYKEGERKT